MPEPRLYTTTVEDSESLEGSERGGGRYSETVTSFPEGNYTGMVNHLGKPSGRGIMRFHDGSVYDGEWQNSVMVGTGVSLMMKHLHENLQQFIIFTSL